jgi:hypothetical protein
MSRESKTITGDNVLILAGGYTLSAEDSGKKVFLNLAGGMAIKLPAPEAGLEFTFIVKTALTSAATITAVDGAGTAANIIKGHVLSADLNAASDGDIDTTAVDVITLAANKAVAGDRVHVVCDGTIWYYSAAVSVFDAVTAG